MSAYQNSFQQGSTHARRGRNDCSTTQSVRAKALVEDRSTTANRQLKTASGQTGGDSQTRWWTGTTGVVRHGIVSLMNRFENKERLAIKPPMAAEAWHFFGLGSVSPTGSVAGLAAHLRSDIFRSQLLFPSRAKCPSGGDSGSGISARRLSLGDRPPRVDCLARYRMVVECRTRITTSSNKPAVPDLEKFFDRVHHDRLLARIAEHCAGN